MHIHLDALGGLAGDMFVGALLGAFPEHKDDLFESIRSATRGLQLDCRLEPHNDGVLQGFDFLLSCNPIVDIWSRIRQVPVTPTTICRMMGPAEVIITSIAG